MRWLRKIIGWPVQYSPDEVQQISDDLGDMYFDCPHCGHNERLNNVGKVVYESNPFAYKEYSCKGCNRVFDAGPRMKFGKCPGYDYSKE
jgi:DNA-directed RNA polymerase subunit RPC12/RpoP